MKKLGILLIVLVMCLPAYGYILVYDLIMSGASADFETDPNGWLLKTNSGHGYLVLDVDDTDANVLNDVNFIDYYKENAAYKVYEEWTSGPDFSQTILPGRPPKRNIVDVNIDLNLNSETMTGRVLGTVSSTSIGTLNKIGKTKYVNVATSLKGVCCVDDTGDIGYGVLSLTLDSKWTMTANNPNLTKGFDGNIGSFLNPTSDTPQGLINWLESKKGGGYIPPID